MNIPFIWRIASGYKAFFFAACWCLKNGMFAVGFTVATAATMLPGFSGLHAAPLFSGNADGVVVANDDFVNMVENTSWSINVLNNDYGVGNKPAQMIITDPPEYGTAEITDKYSVKYTPGERFVGRDEFSYRICNSSGVCDEATVGVKVNDYDYVPVANDDVFRFHPDSNMIIDVLANDEMIFDHPLNLKISRDLNNGTTKITDDLKLDIYINTHLVETDSLFYEVCDAEGDCDNATVYVIPYPGQELQSIVPEGFSPNGDGYNDTFWTPRFDNYELMTLKVFNRNGVLVFESDDYDNGWDGKANAGPLEGKVVPRGVYYYVLQIRDISREVKGSVFVSH